MLKHALVGDLKNRDTVLTTAPATWKYKRGEVAYFHLTVIFIGGKESSRVGALWDVFRTLSATDQSWTPLYIAACHIVNLLWWLVAPEQCTAH